LLCDVTDRSGTSTKQLIVPTIHRQQSQHLYEFDVDDGFETILKMMQMIIVLLLLLMMRMMKPHVFVVDAI
jgi:hypothetical protein